MQDITVTFENEQESEFPIDVDIGEHIFENKGGNLHDVNDQDRRNYNNCLLNTTPREAIDSAIEVIYAAPTFDHIDDSLLDLDSTTATVTFSDIE